MNWQALNLASSEYAAEPDPPASALHGLLYRGKRHIVSGPSESAKTLIVWALALEGLRAGIRVACVDFEMGPTATRRLLVDLGATDDELAAITYYEPTSEPAAADLDEIAAAADIVLIDAAAGAYDVSGLDDNKRADAERFARTWIAPLWQRGIATVLIDHVVKAAENRGRYAIGSERKLGGADVHLGIEIVKTLTRGGSGLVKMRVHKDRPGFLSRPTAAEVVLESDPETHRITFQIRADTNTGDTFRPTVLMEKVSRLIEVEPTKRTDIYAAIKGKRDYLIVAVDVLIAEGYASPSVPGEKGTTIRSLKPFRDDPSPSSPPYPSSRGSFVPSVPPPTGGDGDGDGREWDVDYYEQVAMTMAEEGYFDA